MYITYQITNLTNNKYYIGKTSLKRWNNGYMGSGKTLRKAITKYGKNCFTRKILSTFNTEEQALADEQRRLTLDVINDPLCYNLSGGGIGGGSGELHPMYGKKNPTRAAMNKQATGELHPMFGKKNTKLSAYLLGKKRPEHSAKLKGRKYPKNSAQSLRMRGENNPNTKANRLKRLQQKERI